MVTCTGIYADVVFAENTNSKDAQNIIKERKKMSLLQEQYNDYKAHYAENIKFDSTSENFSKFYP